MNNENFSIYPRSLEITPPKRLDFSNDETYTVQAQKAAEHMLCVIDGRPKPYHGDVTYDKIKSVIQSVNSSGYFNKKYEGSSEDATIANDIEGNVDPNATNENDVQDLLTEDLNQPESLSEEIDVESVVVSNEDEIEIAEAPAPSAVPAPVFPPPIIANPVPSIPSNLPAQPIPIATIVSGPVAGVVPPTAIAVPPNQLSHIGPTTVRAVEQAYYKQHQYIQQIRPITEVLGSGSFYFLQESELDSPDPFPNVNFQNVQPQIIGIQHSPTGLQQVQQQQQPPPPQTQHHQLPQPQLIQHQQPQPQPQQQQQTQQNPHQHSIQQQQSAKNQTASGIPTQTFTNQNFKPIVPQTTGIYQPMKPSDLNSAHIPGFATNNASMPVAISPAGSILSVPNQNSVHIIAPASGAVPIPGFVSPQYPPNLIPVQQNVPIQQQQPQSPPHHIMPQQPPVTQLQQQQPPPVQQIMHENSILGSGGSQPNEPIHQNEPTQISHGKMSPIENWDASESSTVVQNETSNEWRDTGMIDNSREPIPKDWSSESPQTESNTWHNDSNQDHGYNRGYQRGGPRNNSGPRGSGGRQSSGSINKRSNEFDSIRNRNNRESSGNGNTYFRNNDNNNYYQMQNGSNSGGNRNGSGGHSGNYPDSRNYNSGFSNGTYKPRGGGSGNNVRSGGGGGGGHLRNNSGNNQDRINQPRPSNGNNLNSRNPGNVQGQGPSPHNSGGDRNNMRSSRGGGNNGGPGGNYNNSPRNGSSSQMPLRSGQLVK